MTESELQEKLHQHLDAHPSEPLPAELEIQLAKHPALDDWWKTMRETELFLAQVYRDEDAEPPADLADRIMSALPRRAPRRNYHILLAAAASVAAVVGTSLFLLHDGSSNDAEPAPQVQLILPKFSPKTNALPALTPDFSTARKVLANGSKTVILEATQALIQISPPPSDAGEENLG